jgi:cystathionine beta-lyase/cystathionine gamma-synthase
MGAVTSTVLALCSAGDHVVAASQLYTSTSGLFAGACPRFGIDVTFVDQTDAEAMAAAVIPGRTRLLYVETPANPVLQLADLEALSAIPGPLKVVDSTFAGPFIQRPLELGFDLVIHSATKSLAGHNDATLGVVAGEEDLLQWIWGFHTIAGAVASPFDALLALRGIRSLGVRVRQACETAQRLAEALEGHPAVPQVNHPGLDSHPQRELAKRQMAYGGSNLSFEVAGGIEAGAGSSPPCACAAWRRRSAGPRRSSPTPPPPPPPGSSRRSARSWASGTGSSGCRSASSTRTTSSPTWSRPSPRPRRDAGSAGHRVAPPGRARPQPVPSAR